MCFKFNMGFFVNLLLKNEITLLFLWICEMILILSKCEVIGGCRQRIYIKKRRDLVNLFLLKYALTIVHRNKISWGNAALCVHAIWMDKVYQGCKKIFCNYFQTSNTICCSLTKLLLFVKRGNPLLYLIKTNFYECFVLFPKNLNFLGICNFSLLQSKGS